MKSYDKLSIPARVVRDPEAIDLAQVRDPFIKPTRTLPLPPLDWPQLQLPPLPALPILMPPLSAGPGLSHWYTLRRDPAKPRVVLRPEQAGKPAAGAAAASASASDNTTEGGDKAWELAYDKLETVDNRSYWGQILGDDRYQHGTTSEEHPLALSPPFKSQVLLRRIDPVKGSVVIAEMPFEPNQITRILFADTIQNRLALARRRIPAGETGLRDRERLVARLLGSESQHPEALDEAEVQARKITEIAPDKRQGWDLLLGVYARTGQLEKEAALFDELAKGAFAEAAFVARAQGVLFAQLGLSEDAESKLREALRRDASDPRNGLALSRFLSQRGRDQEALEIIQLAYRSLAPAHAEDLRAQTLMQLARAALALGDEKLANRSLDEASALAPPAELLFLRGAVELAAGKVAEASKNLVAAAASLPNSVEALVGAGLCAFRAGRFDEAMEAFSRAESRDPLERQLALAAQGFLLMLVPGRLQDAVSRLERAKLIAPRDPYVLYLLGRGYRLSQRYEEARRVLDACLRERFDFVEAAIELARTELEEARRNPGEGFSLLENAERLAARACMQEGTRAKLPLYREMLGIVRYHLRKNDRAREAFDGAIAWGGDVHAKVWKALLRNRQGHGDEAVAMLRNIGQFIKDPQDPLKSWAELTRKRLAIHLGKRVVRDDFEAQAKHWTVKRNGQQKIRWTFGDNTLRVKGASSRELPCWTRYTLERARDFVSVALDADFGQTEGAALFLRLSDEREIGGGKSRSTIDVRVGFDGRRKFAYARRGAQESKKNTLRVDAEEKPELFASPAGQPVRLEIEYEQLVENEGDDGSIVVRWAGKEVARKKMRLSASGNRELYIDIRCEPRLGSQVDASFSKFRLVRFGQ